MSIFNRASYLTLAALLAIVPAACGGDDDDDDDTTDGATPDASGGDGTPDAAVETPDAAVVTPDAAVGGGDPADIAGSFLLSIQTPLGGPLRLIADVEYTAAGEGGTADFTFQPIVATNCDEKTGGQPAGDPVTVTGVTINADGTFELALDDVTVDGSANAIICDAEIQADLVVTGGVNDADLNCGTISGMVTAPVMAPLDGSTFGAVRVEPGTVGDANLPTPVIECP